MMQHSINDFKIFDIMNKIQMFILYDRLQKYTAQNINNHLLNKEKHITLITTFTFKRI